MANAAPGLQQRPRPSPAQSAAVTVIPGIVFSGGLDGHLRAYSAEDGHIVWDVDTNLEIARSMVLRPTAAQLMGRAQLSLVAHFTLAPDTAFLGACLETCFWPTR